MIDDDEFLEVELSTALSSLLWQDVEQALKHLDDNEIPLCRDTLSKVLATMHSIITITKLYEDTQLNCEQNLHPTTTTTKH